MANAHLDKKIAKYKRKLCDLYFQRNTLTPIFRLPTENLQAIFICLARDFYSQSSVASRRSTVPYWVNVSYVCRRWRDVALNCSTLWTYLFILSPRWTEELLARSKRASLKVNVDLNESTRSQASRFLEQVVKRSECIQEFHLCVDYSYHVVVSSLSSPAPRLTNLSIEVSNEISMSDWPSVLFDGDTPVLLTLELTCCPTPWYSLEVAGLTSLSLHKVPGPFRQNTADFLATLWCMPNLTHLVLDDALSSATGFLSNIAFEAIEKIRLSRLSRLRINAPISTVIALLRCLDVPLETLVRLECATESDLSLDYYASLSSLLAQRFDASNAHASSGPIVRAVEMDFRSDSVGLAFSVLEQVSWEDETWDRNIPLDIDIHLDESMVTSCNDWNLASNICCSMPLANVRGLSVYELPSSSAFWRMIFRHLRSLRDLVLKGGTMPDLTPLLPIGNRGNRGYTPALKKLELFRVAFTTGPGCLADVQSLYDALSRRKGSRGRLIMHDCTFAVPSGRGKLDMVGGWEDGHFRLVEERTKYY